MQIATDVGLVEVMDEPTYTLGSADNSRRYPHELNLAPSERPSSIHGVLLDGKTVVVLANSGGASGAHEHSALYIRGRLFVAVGDSIVCMTLRPFQILWSLCVDEATCFGIHHHAETDALISHGELEIARFSESGELLWSAGGRDIFTGRFSLQPLYIEAEDFEGDVYRFSYKDGKGGLSR